MVYKNPVKYTDPTGMCTVPDDAVPDAIKNLDGYDENKKDMPVSLSLSNSTSSSTPSIARDRVAETQKAKQNKQSLAWAMSGERDKGGLVSDNTLFEVVTIGVSGPTKGVDGLINKLGALSLSSDIINGTAEAVKGNFDKVLKIGLNNAVGFLTGKATSYLLVKKGLQKYDSVVNYFGGHLTAKGVDKIYNKVNEEK